MFEWGHELPTLSGRRLNLRALTRRDAPAVLAVFGDPEVMRFWSSPPLQDLAAATELVEEIEGLFVSRRLFQWGICSRDPDEVFGTCTLLNLDVAHRRGEVGFALARAAYVADRSVPTKREEVQVPRVSDRGRRRHGVPPTPPTAGSRRGSRSTRRSRSAAPHRAG